MSARVVSRCQNIAIVRLIQRALIFFVCSVIGVACLGVWLQSVLLPAGFYNIYESSRFAYFSAFWVATLWTLMFLLLFRRKREVHEMVVDGVIVAFLCAAVLVGLIFVMLQLRPARVVFVGDHFRVVSAFELQSNGLALPVIESLKGAMQGPTMHVMNWPADADARQALLFAELGGQNPVAQVNLHAAYSLERVQPALKSLSELDAASVSRLRLAAELPDGLGCAVEDLGWLPVKSRFGFHTALISRRSGRVCRVEDVDLWRR